MSGLKDVLRALATVAVRSATLCATLRRRHVWHWILVSPLAGAAFSANAALFDWWWKPSTRDPVADLVTHARKLGARRAFFSERHQAPGNIYGLSPLVVGAGEGGPFTFNREMDKSHFNHSIEIYEQLRYGRHHAAQDATLMSTISRPLVYWQDDFAPYTAMISVLERETTTLRGLFFYMPGNRPMSRMLSDEGFAVALMGAGHAEKRFNSYTPEYATGTLPWYPRKLFANRFTAGMAREDVVDMFGGFWRAYELALNPVLLRLNNTDESEIPEYAFSRSIPGYVAEGFPVVEGPVGPGLGAMIPFSPALLPGMVDHLKRWGPWPYGKPVLHCRGIPGCPSGPLFKDEL